MKLSAITNIIFWIAFSLTSCKAKTNAKIGFIDLATDTVTNAKYISMRDLVKNHSVLDGQVIETEGIVYFEFENESICPDNGWEGKCFWVDLNKDLVTNDILNDILLHKVSGRKFILKGTIDNSRKGHLGAYEGTITNVYYLKSK